MTIENYFMLTQEHKIYKDRILELESQVKRQNEINEEQKKNNEEMTVKYEEMTAKYEEMRANNEEIRANNEEMREFMKQLAKKIN
jgi:methyl-accepting chemotaxis protein